MAANLTMRSPYGVTKLARDEKRVTPSSLRLHRLAQKIENLRRYGEAVAVAVKRAQLGEMPIGIARQARQPVEQRQVVRRDRGVADGHRAPHVPGQHLPV